MKPTCLVAATLVMSLAGCGGGGGGKAVQQPASVPTVTISQNAVTLGKQVYDQTMKRLGRQLGGSVAQLFPLAQAQPGSDVNKQSLEKLKSARAVVTSLIVKIGNIAPPAAIRPEHQRLLQGLSALGGELDTLIQVEENGGSKPFGAYTRFLSLRTIAKAKTAIEKKGYAIG